MGSSTAPSWLLLPGHLCTDTLWAGLRAQLVTEGREIKSADLFSDASVEAMARRAIASLRAQTVLVGFSMGGLVALRIHALAPDLVAGMVLISSNARAHMSERNAARIEQEQRARAGGFAKIVAGDLVPSYFAPKNADIAVLRQSAIAMASEVGPEVFVRQSQAIRTRPDARASLAGIQCPCLIIGGGHDPLSPPEWQQELAAGIPASELAMIEGAGHFVPLEAPSALGATIRDWSTRHGL